MLSIVLLLATLAGQAGDASAPAHDTLGLKVLSFSAEWCGPCKAMKPRLEKLEAKGYPIQEVDIDTAPLTAKRYGVDRVPTFVLIDRQGKELARTVGAVTATDLAEWYSAEWRKHRDDGDTATEPKSAPQAPRPPPAKANSIPSPWETTCRVQIEVTNPAQKGYRGYGSGTVISSDGTTTIILTCAHVFDMGNPGKLPAKQFPSVITINLSDGNPTGDPPKAKFGKSYPGTALDYDFTKDVGLITISTSDVLAASPIVPSTWRAEPGMELEQYGCKGADYPTTFRTTVIDANAGMPGQWQGIKCSRMPGEGRSGGGLFTLDHHLCGVTDFRGNGATRQDDIGLYAGPASIYSILDRNGLKRLYAAGKPPNPTPQPLEAEQSFTPANELEATCFDIFRRLHGKCPPNGGSPANPPQPGPDGPPGQKGDAGVPGIPGETGPPGPPGPIGPQGPPGKDSTPAPGPIPGGASAGPPGPQGLPGLPGAIGKDGPAGKQGPAGPPGRDGKDGAAGLKGECQCEHKPTKFAVRLPGGRVVEKEFMLSGPDATGVGLDLSGFAVPGMAALQKQLIDLQQQVATLKAAAK